MKAGVDDFLVANGRKDFEELLKNAWPFESTFTDSEAEVAWQTKNITVFTPDNEQASALGVLVPFLARRKNLEAESVLNFLKNRLNLKRSVFAALKQDIKDARKQAKRQPQDSTAPRVSKEEELKELKPLAEDLAKSPDILETVVETLRQIGLAGQEQEAKLLYLALTSRVLDRIVNVAVKGPSSGGKSFLVGQVLRLFPKSAYYALTGMSEKALVHFQEPLKNRFLVIYEAVGMGGDLSQYFIRSLLSEGRLRYQTAVKVNEKWVGWKIDLEGPTGLIVTTTKTGLHPENETRMMSMDINVCYLTCPRYNYRGQVK